MQALDDSVVDRERAIIEVARERDAVVVHVAKRRTEQRLWRLFRTVRIDPREELVVDGARLLASRGETFVRTRFGDGLLDVVELLVRGDRQRGARVLRIEGLLEVAAAVGVIRSPG